MSAELRAVLARHVHEASIAKLTPGEPSNPLASRFGGSPYLEKGETWPLCGDCHDPLTFICQINFDECKHSGRPSGLATFFYCGECFPWGLDDETGGAWRLKIYDQPSTTNLVELDDPGKSFLNVEPCTIHFDLAKTCPDYEAADSIEEIADAMARTDDGYDALEAAAKSLGCNTEGPTQIGGYAAWVQGENIPKCHGCKKAMPLLLQVDSEDEAGIMWGDCGRVYFFRCPDHPSDVRFELQCY